MAASAGHADCNTRVAKSRKILDFGIKMGKISSLSKTESFVNP